MPGRPASGGRRRPSRLFLHLLLIAACLPAVFPFLWLLGSSLQRRENVFTSPPRWLPRTEITTLHAGDAEIPVHVLDRAEDTGAWRVRIRADEEAPGVSGDLLGVATVTNELTVAVIHELHQRVEPAGVTPDGRRIVRIPGRRRRVPVSAGEVEERRETEFLLDALRQKISVDAEGRNVLAAGSAFPVAADRVRDPETAPYFPWDGFEIPVEIAGRLPEAGVLRVRPRPGPIRGTVDPAAIARREIRRLYYCTDGGAVECRWIERRPDGSGIISIPGQLDETILPADTVRIEPVIEYRGRILGQTVRVEPLDGRPGRWKVLDPIVASADRFTTLSFVDPQWRNYPMALRREPFHLYLLNTLFITVCCVLGNVISCGMVGYAFARIPFRGRGILFLLLLSTMMVPAQVTMIPTFALFTHIGWLDTYRPLILPSLLAQSAFFVFLYRQFFLSVPLELEDAARVDGAGHLRTFWHIMLPIARPAAVTVAVFSFLAAWNDFLGPLLYINSDEKQTLALGLQNFKTSFGYSDPHYLMAASLVMMLPTLIIFFAAQRSFMQGVAVTGVKG